MVYFIGNKEHKIVKIGTTGSEDVRVRLGGLQSGNHLKLEVLCVLEGDYRHENYLHNKFINDNIRAEWFNISTEINSFINNPISPSIIEIIDQPKIKKARHYSVD